MTAAASPVGPVAGALAPALSVVVPSVNGWTDLEGCLDALRAQDLGRSIEILVADRTGAAVRAAVRERYPAVRLLEAAPGTTIPDLRAMAFAAAAGDVVAVIEDHVVVPRDWARRMLAVQAEGHPVVGGSVANAATQRLVDWAAFLCEYSHCLAPPRGPSDWVTGNNVTYARARLAKLEAVWRSGQWENHLHEALKADGVVLESRPDIVVGHKMHYTVGLYLSQRFLYSRSYAGGRVRGAGPVRRLVMGLATLALPPVLLLRIVRRVRATAGADVRRWLAPSLPLIALFTVGWAAGETVGYWFGAGNALARVR